MPLPLRKYYSLEKAALNVGCDVDDLIHYAVIGLLQLCVKIPPLGCGFNCEDAHIGPDSVFDGNSYLHMGGNADEVSNGILLEYSSSYTSCKELAFVKHGVKTTAHLSGLVAFSQKDIEYYESDLISAYGSLSTDFLLFPRSENIVATSGYSVRGFNLDVQYEFNKSDFLISNYELNLLKEGGMSLIEVNGHSFEQPKSFNKQRAKGFLSFLIAANPKLGVNVANSSVNHIVESLEKLWAESSAKDSALKDFLNDYKTIDRKTLNKYLEIFND